LEDLRVEAFATAVTIAVAAFSIAAVSSEDKLALTKAHGASDGLVYGRGPFDKEGAKTLAEQFKTACGKSGANVIYDAVGGDYAEAALRAIAWEGRFLVVGFPAGIPRIPLNLALLKGCQIVGVFWGSWTERDVTENARNNEELLEMYRQGKIKPHVSKRYSLGETGRAIEELSGRRALGKIGVTVD
jgi:NADPH2:quinone reductase